MKPLSFYARVTVLVAHLLLLAGLFWWSTTNLGRLFSAVLLLPLPGLLRGREYTHAWASLMLCIYCAALLAEGVAVRANLAVSMTLAVLAAADFCGMVLYVRLRGREKLAAVSDSGSTARTAASDGASR